MSEYNFDPITCPSCGTILEVGQFPFCGGTASNHGPSLTMKSGNGVFPFETKNVDGKPMVIESMQQLRKVERDFGVVFSAFSRDNWQDCSPVDERLPKFRGDDEDVRRDYKKRY